MKNRHMPTGRGRNSAFSLVELVVTIGVLGVISGISLSYFGGTLKSSKSVVANEMAETLNLGLKKHAQVNYEFNLDADDDDSADEIAVVRSLQYRHPTNPAPGAPFVRSNWHPVGSDDDADFRLRWNGTVFEILKPETEGSGIKVDFGASDYGENYTFPNDFTPVGG
jgi:prepilin-type N-terminal cleavage/methylation domain-containing protein